MGKVEIESKDPRWFGRTVSLFSDLEGNVSESARERKGNYHIIIFACTWKKICH